MAQEEAREFIRNRHGEKFLPGKLPKHKNTDKGAQEAHEAIRPTSVLRTPRQMKEFLKRDQYRLYQMIWQRFVASQMEAAVYEVPGFRFVPAGNNVLNCLMDFSLSTV